MTNYHLSKKSSNVKTGKIPVTTSDRKTCPDACPFKSNGCYAEHGHLSWHWNKVSSGERGVSFDEHIEQLKSLPKSRMRLFQAGDMPGVGNNINIKQTKKLVNALKGFEVFTYTHKDLGLDKNRKIVKYCNDNGLTINLSANSLTHADELIDMNIGPVTVTIPEGSGKTKTPKGRKVIICPAIISDKIQCANCGGKKGALCWRQDRNYVIGFPAHGSGKKKVSEIVGK